MKIILITMLIVLSGCAEYRALIATNGAESADATLESAEWAICKAATSGALERRYSLFSAPESRKGQGWAQLCHGVDNTTKLEF